MTARRSQPELSVAIETGHPIELRAAWELARAWREHRGGWVRPSIVGRVGPSVRIGLGSLVRPSPVVHFALPFAEEPGRIAHRLALTVAAWDALEALEPWRVLTAPIPRAPRLGTPDAARPWALALGHSQSVRSAEHQLHVIGGLPRTSRDDVWWPRVPRVVAALLGRASVVIGEADPLVYDALRAGVEILGVGASPRPVLLDGCSLAGLVPPSLVGDPELWRHVARTATDVHATGRAPAPLMTPDWIARGRARIREHLSGSPGLWTRLARRRDKLRRDPKRFFSDSRHAGVRRIGALLFSENGP